MKIVFLSTMRGFPWGGSEELWHQTALHAVKSGHQVMAVVYDWGTDNIKIATLKNAGGTVVKIARPETYSRSKRLFNRFSPETWLAEFDKVVKFNPDCVCASQGSTFDIVSHTLYKNLLTRLNKPYFLISQGNSETGGIIPESVVPEIVRWTGRAKKYFFVAKRNHLTAERQLATKITNAAFISNPVNISSHRIVEFPKTVDKLMIACVARFDSNSKGQDILIQTMSSQLWRDRSFQLNFFGSGPHEVFLKRLISFYEMDDKITVVGNTNDIDGVWKSHHVLALPSFGEGTPLVVLEAMLCARAVLGTDVGDVSRYVIDNETGYLAPVASVISLGLSLEKLWENRDQLEHMGQRAYHHALSITDITPEKTLLDALLESSGEKPANS